MFPRILEGIFLLIAVFIVCYQHGIATELRAQITMLEQSPFKALEACIEAAERNYDAFYAQEDKSFQEIKEGLTGLDLMREADYHWEDIAGLKTDRDAAEERCVKLWK